MLCCAALCRHVWFLCSPEGVLYGQPLQLSALLAHYPTGAATAGLQQQQQGSHLFPLRLRLMGGRCWAVNVLQGLDATHAFRLLTSSLCCSRCWCWCWWCPLCAAGLTASGQCVCVARADMVQAGQGAVSQLLEAVTTCQAREQQLRHSLALQMQGVVQHLTHVSETLSLSMAL